MALAPWNALGGGRLKSKKQIEALKKDGETMRWGAEQSETERKFSEALEKVGAEHGVDSVQAVALAYIMQKTTNCFSIVGGGKVEYLKDTIKALGINITDKDIEYLESVQEFSVGFPMDIAGPDPRVAGQPSFILAPSGPMAFQLYDKPIGRA
jgi:aryl-alcohol dehydrogenase-like predicted oxidoreductase